MSTPRRPRPTTPRPGRPRRRRPTSSTSSSPSTSASPASPALGVERFWRVVGCLRIAALIYAVVTAIDERSRYSRPAVVVATLAVMAAWTILTTFLPVRRNSRLLMADLVIAVAAVLATRLAESITHVHAGSPTIPLVWVTGAVLSWALVCGPRGGGGAGAVIGLADILERGAASQQAVNGAVLLVLTGLLVGFTSELSRRAEAEVTAAATLAAAAEERTRLAAAVHDGVLQVLALVQRGGGELAGAAGEQEAALRALLARPALAFAAGDAVDLLSLLGDLAGRAELIAPLQAVNLPAARAELLAAAVAAALDNVARHAGPEARAWVLVDDEGGAVRVTVRDDGVGFAADRLAEAEREGRLGVAASIRGRLGTLGGTATFTSTPGAGTVVELRVPR